VIQVGSDADRLDRHLGSLNRIGLHARNKSNPDDVLSPGSFWNVKMMSRFRIKAHLRSQYLVLGLNAQCGVAHFGNLVDGQQIDRA
jgi:hypothetical protein